MEFYKAYYSSPIGTIEITGNEEGLASLYFIDDKPKPGKSKTKIHASLQQCITQLDEYFKGTRTDFDVLINAERTEFRKRVWNELLKIPFGKTTTYLQISKQLGDANATRAVGNANGSNPVSVIIPCHRVIGVNGKLVGYGGGMWRKEWLLNHENSKIFGKQGRLF